MQNFTREQIIVAFYVQGKGCIDNSELIFNSSNKVGYDLLLYHGIELILKSFIIMKENSIPFEILMEKLRSKEYGHTLEKLYAYCLKLDKSFFEDTTFKYNIEFLYSLYSGSSIDIRYHTKSQLRTFPITIYNSIREEVFSRLKEQIDVYTQISKHDFGPILDLDDEYSLKIFDGK